MNTNNKCHVKKKKKKHKLWNFLPEDAGGFKKCLDKPWGGKTYKVIVSPEALYLRRLKDRAAGKRHSKLPHFKHLVLAAAGWLGLLFWLRVLILLFLHR